MTEHFMKASIVCDSIAPNGVRITTFSLSYMRFIHAEFMTHREFSRNASSSRAIPVKRMISDIKTSPAMPIHWGKNISGMQAYEEVDDDSKDKAKKIWLKARDLMLGCVKELEDLGIHKQAANRLLEPFQYIRVIVTSTNWSNFFALRKHKAAQPEIRELAKMMMKEYKASHPKKLDVGEWHLPYIGENDYHEAMSYLNRLPETIVDINAQARTLLLKMSTARCARVSYLNHDNSSPSIEKDIELHDRLVGKEIIDSGDPIHASPSEHQAMATGDKNIRSGNLRGWIQYRKTIVGEYIDDFSKIKEN